MYFTIIGTVSSIETMAAGSGIRDRARLAKLYGPVRVIDESGEDCLYPARMFHKVELPVAVRRAVFEAA